MTPLQTLLDALGWSRAYAANRCGVSGSQMRYWAEGVNTRGNPSEAPTWVVDYLRRVLAAVDKVPLKRPKVAGLALARRDEGDQNG